MLLVLFSTSFDVCTEQIYVRTFFPAAFHFSMELDLLCSSSLIQTSKDCFSQLRALSRVKASFCLFLRLEVPPAPTIKLCKGKSFWPRLTPLFVLAFDTIIEQEAFLDGSAMMKKSTSLFSLLDCFV